MAANTYPDHIDAHKDVDGVVVRNVLEHSHAGVKVRISGHVIRHFVHAQRALWGMQVSNKMAVLARYVRNM